MFVAHVIVESCWVRQLLHELHQLIDRSIVVYCNNICVVYLSANLVQHQRTKHIEVDIHFVWDKVQVGEVHVLHVPTTLQFADIITKELHVGPFKEF
jgi:hypothetical protein